MINLADKGNARAIRRWLVGRRLRNGFVAAVAVLAVGQGAVQGQTQYKADNNLAATDPLSWIGGVVPLGSNNAVPNAVWDNRVTGATTIDITGWTLNRNSGQQALGVKIEDPGGLVTLTSASTTPINMTRSGFDLSTATQNLRIDARLSNSSDTTEFRVASGRTVEILKPFSFGGNGTRLLLLNGISSSGTGGRVDIPANITAGGTAGSVTIQNGITATFGGNNTFPGTLTLSGSSRLYVNNAAGSGTSSGAFSVPSTATLGGLGFIGSSTTVTGYLAPGAETGVGSVGTLAFNNNLTISGIRAGGLKFELAGTSASDKVVVGNGGILDIGTLTWDKFDFTPLAGFGPGTYTLFDTAGGSITGTIDEFNKSGQIAGYDAYLQTGSLQLVVVPEPGGIALGIAGAVAAGAVGLARRSRRRA